MLMPCALTQQTNKGLVFARQSILVGQGIEEREGGGNNIYSEVKQIYRIQKDNPDSTDS